MVGQGGEAAIKSALLAREDRIDHRFQVVAHHPDRNPAEEGERPDVRVEHHLLGLAGVGRHEHLAAVGQAEVGQLGGLRRPAQFDRFVAPVELAGLAGREGQRHEGLGHAGAAGTGSLPPLHETPRRTVRAPVAFGLRPLEQPPGRPTLPPGQAGLEIQPLFKPGLETARLGTGRLPTLVNRLLKRGQRLADSRAGKLKVAGDGADALAPHKMTPSDFGYEFHAYHPRLLRLKSRMVAQLRGGKNSTLFPRIPGKFSTLINTVVLPLVPLMASPSRFSTSFLDRITRLASL